MDRKCAGGKAGKPLVVPGLLHTRDEGGAVWARAEAAMNASTRRMTLNMMGGGDSRQKERTGMKDFVRLQFDAGA